MIHVTCIHLWMQPHLRWTVPFTRTTPHLAQQTKTAGERKKQSEASQRRAGWSPVPSEREKATLPGVSEPPCSEPVPTQLEPTFKQTSNMSPPISIKNRTKKKKQIQPWSQMIHTSIISALNNAGNPHITTRLLPGKCTEAKRGHALPAADWRLDPGERHTAVGNRSWG